MQSPFGNIEGLTTSGLQGQLMDWAAGGFSESAPIFQQLKPLLAQYLQQNMGAGNQPQAQMPNYNQGQLAQAAQGVHGGQTGGYGVLGQYMNQAQQQMPQQFQGTTNPWAGGMNRLYRNW